MALTEHDKNTLSKSDQQKIIEATNAWESANARGDTNGMKEAADAAAAVRNNAGYRTDDSGNYIGSYTPNSNGGSSGGTSGGSSGGVGGYSQYTGSSNGITINDSTQQGIKDIMNANSIAWWSADENERRRLHEENQLLSRILGGTVSYDDYSGTWSGVADGNNDYDDKNKDYYEEILSQYKDVLAELERNRPEEYERPHDPQIDVLLNQILNRDDFSYDVMNDPLYQQYAQMYRREGDRAMKETMAEAAASAGGMNTYAMTAAQQANSYYNSQLNDKIPQLYQLAYDMYINDKESKVQDLGILQNMDATQYNRYRDTINDYYNDKNFAYGVYQDAVQQGNWQTTFDNNNYWANKEFNANQGQIDLKNNRYDQETAENRLWEFIDRGIMPSDDIITQAGWEKADVERLVAATLAGKTKSVNGNYTKYTLADEWATKINNDIISKYGNGFTALKSNGDGTYTVGDGVGAEYIIYNILNSDVLKDEEKNQLLDAFGITDSQINTVLKDPHYR